MGTDGEDPPKDGISSVGAHTTVGALGTSGAPDAIGRTPASTSTSTSTSTALAEPVLRVSDLSVRYGGVYALRDVDLEIGDGELCGLIGANGAGKTTFFDVVSGHGSPTAGRLELGGQDVTRRSPVWRSRHGVRRTFQRQQVFGALTVRHNVTAAQDWRGGEGGFIGDLLGLPFGRQVRAERADRVGHVLELCGLSEVQDVYAGNLPIGAARMVELARAVVDPPRLLLLDEPTSGLSRDQTDRLAEVVATVRAETGCAVLLVEHDVPFVMAQCERVICLSLGEVLAVGSPEEIQQNAEVRQAYLG